jgi:hypothetical protein
MTLHEAIIQVLKTAGRPMSTTEIADKLNHNGLYRKRDGSAISAFQIHGRTSNYSHLFDRDGSMVSLKDQKGTPQKNTSVQIKMDEPIESTKPMKDIEEIEKELLEESNFKSVDEIDDLIPYTTGLYAIRIKKGAVLPEPFNEELDKRDHNIIYIGIATKSFKRRLNQELRAKGHGTFFRSMGAVLGYCPPAGSLIDKKNKRNYKFSVEDAQKIISWFNENLLVNWVEVDDKKMIEEAENYLIPKYAPLINLDKNPKALQELSMLRKKCVEVANSLKK